MPSTSSRLVAAIPESMKNSCGGAIHLRPAEILLSGALLLKVDWFISRMFLLILSTFSPKRRGSGDGAPCSACRCCETVHQLAQCLSHAPPCDLSQTNRSNYSPPSLTKP